MDASILCLAFGLVSASPSLSPLPKARVEFGCSHMEEVVVAAEANQLDPAVLSALIYVESRWTKDAVSRSGACGLTQVIPRYVPQTCNELKNPSTSIRVGAASLKKWTTIRVRRGGKLVRVPRKGGIREALACYTAGNACLKSSHGRNYARAVLRHAERLRGAYNQIQSGGGNNNFTRQLGYQPISSDFPSIVPHDVTEGAIIYLPTYQVRRLAL